MPSFARAMAARMSGAMAAALSLAKNMWAFRAMGENSSYRLGGARSLEEMAQFRVRRTLVFMGRIWQCKLGQYCCPSWRPARCPWPACHPAHIVDGDKRICAGVRREDEHGRGKEERDKSERGAQARRQVYAVCAKLGHTRPL